MTMGVVEAGYKRTALAIDNSGVDTWANGRFACTYANYLAQAYCHPGASWSDRIQCNDRGVVQDQVWSSPGHKAIAVVRCPRVRIDGR